MNFGGRILVPSMDWSHPSGGVRKLYHHVDILNAHGIPAYIVHQQPGFRCTWFENNTPVTSIAAGWPPRAGDVLMVPEILAWQFVALAPGVPKVVFSQNAYQTFQGVTDQFRAVPYQQPDTLATIVVSEDSRAYLEHAFPGHRIFRIHYSVDPALFGCGADKKRQIALMPRKKEFEVKQVMSLLECRGVLRGFDVAKIEDKSEAETAAILRESIIFLSFSAMEGWGLPPMEAMACGCITIGFDGRGGREFFREPYAIPVEPEDVIGFAAAVEGVIHQLNQNPRPLMEKARQSSQFVLSAYTPQREEQDILATWEQVISLSTAGRGS